MGGTESSTHIKRGVKNSVHGIDPAGRPGEEGRNVRSSYLHPFPDITALVDNISSSNCCNDEKSARPQSARQHAAAAGRRGTHSDGCTQRSRTAHDRRPSSHRYAPPQPLAKLAPHLHSTIHQRSSNSITATKLAGINQSKTTSNVSHHLSQHII